MIAVTLIILSLVVTASKAQNIHRNQKGGKRTGVRTNFPDEVGQVVPIIIRDDRTGPDEGVYSFDFETGDGIRRKEQGSPSASNGAVVQRGSWSFTFPDGTPAQFSFVADENGYQVQSPLLPTPPPLPQHAIDQIEKAERERAQGIVHDGQYRPEQYEGDSGQYRPQHHGGEGSRKPSQRQPQQQITSQGISRKSTSPRQPEQQFASLRSTKKTIPTKQQQGHFGQGSSGRRKVSSSQPQQQQQPQQQFKKFSRKQSRQPIHTQ